MRRRDFIAAAASAGTVFPTKPMQRRQPNIVVILADDMGYSDIGCYGGEMETPNLDSLAAKGVRFTQFYNAARCCPTRASLMTGLHPHQAGIGHMMEDRKRPGYRGDLTRNCVTLAEVLRLAGYRTAMAGKWHLTPYGAAKHNWPLQRGFERFYGTIRGGGSYFQPLSLSRGNDLIETPSGGYYYTDAIAEEAERSVRDWGRGEQPFFLYVAFTAPHWPLHALSSEIRKYSSRYEGGWDRLRAERLRRLAHAGIVDRRWRLTTRDPDVPAWESVPHRQWEARRMAVYAAMIDRMDEGIGRILKALRDTGQEEETLVLFLSDNGGCAERISPDYKDQIAPRKTKAGVATTIGDRPGLMPGSDETFMGYGPGWANASNTPFRLYKHWVHEGGIATPLIAAWPGRMSGAGRLVHEPGHIIDVMATCVEAAGAEYPERYQGERITPMEGRSFLGAFDPRWKPAARSLYWEHEGNRAVRSGRWKLVAQHGRDWELYDMQTDRTETQDRIRRETALAKTLEASYLQWATRCGVEPWDEVYRGTASGA